MAAEPDSPVTITALSDLHGHLPEITEPCDVLVIAGDVVPLEVQDDRSDSAAWLNDELRPWLEDNPAKDTVAIAGNHDLLFLWPDEVPDLPWIYLQDSGATIAGLKFWGSPWTPTHGGWAFEAPDFPGLGIVFDQCPDDVDVLVTHTPPHGRGDGVLEFSHKGGTWVRPAGSEALKHVVDDRKPALHIFGHIHEGRGAKEFDGITFANVSLRDKSYRVAHEPMHFTVENGVATRRERRRRLLRR